MSEFVIDLSYVSKRYSRKTWALDGIAMRVHPGEIFGLLGPNGAGKSTLVKILMTVVRPTVAEGTFLGQPIGTKQVLARVGYLPEQSRFPDYLTGRQTLDYFAALAQVERPMRRRRAEELLELVGLKNWSDRRVSTFSKGMRQRLGIAQALMNDPELVLLDEPTDGLDPLGREFVRRLLERLREEKRTIFLNSHLLGEVEQVCDRVAILKKGKVVRQGNLAELTSENVRYAVEVASADDATSDRIRATLPWQWKPNETDPKQWTGRLPSGETARLESSRLEIATDSASVMQEVIDVLRKNDLTITSLGPVRDSLEQLFFGAMAD